MPENKNLNEKLGFEPCPVQLEVVKVAPSWPIGQSVTSDRTRWSHVQLMNREGQASNPCHHKTTFHLNVRKKEQKNKMDEKHTVENFTS